MTHVTYHHPSSREIVSDLFTRLRRVDAAGNTVAALAETPGTPESMLADSLQALEHDLLLALRAAESARERITR
ncbi:MAG TPA: hypothetical protein VI300_04040 [Solirubrobacter sp.]